MNKKLLITLSFLALAGITTASFYYSEIKNKKFKHEEEEEEPGEDFFYSQRSYPYGVIDYAAQQRAAQQYLDLNTAARMQMVAQWQPAGPVNTGGRIVDVEMHPTNQQIAYLCAASGGVFKTTDGGTSWNPIFDNQPTLSMGDIAIAPSNPSILYVGTGEANGGSGSITYDAKGVFKSIDAGVTWQHVGLDSTRMIGRIAVHPTNPDVAFVASMGEMYAPSSYRGLYRTADGGATWQNVLYVNDSVGAVDVVINPQNPNYVYAATWERMRRVNDKRYYGEESGLWRSTDGGLTFSRLSNGLPVLGGLYSRVGVDLCPSHPNVLYSVYIGDNYDFYGLYRSNDFGTTWAQTSDFDLQGTMGVQGYWWGRVKCDPMDTNTVYVLNYDVHKSTDGGNSFPVIASGHVDQHIVAVHPTNPNFVMIGNDGGLYISNDGGATSVRNLDIPNNQVYRCAIDYSNPTNLYCGVQDNGTNRTLTGALNDYDHIFGGDGFFPLIDPTNSQNIFAEYQYGNIFKSTDGGFNFNQATNGIFGSANWNCPLLFDPANPQTLYTGAQQVFRTDDAGDNWYSISPDLTTIDITGSLLYGTISYIDVSPLNSDIIYVGTDDGKVWNTLNGGGTWNDVTQTLPVRWVSAVACDPFNAGTAYITLSGYRYHDNNKHVYKTINNGQTWTAIDAGLPDIPCNHIIPDPSVANRLYLATDVGVYYTTNGGLGWAACGTGMPIVVCADLKLHDPTRTLVVGTYGRSMYKLDLNQLTGVAEENINPGIDVAVFPNPATEFIKITSASKQNNFSVEVFDEKGKIVFNDAVNKKHKIDVRNWKQGNYFVRIKSGDKVTVKKIIVM